MYLLQRTLNTKIIFIRITRPSNKLDFIRLKPFKIKKVLELVIYKLDLLDGIKITQIYYILVLKLADPEAPLIKDVLYIDPKSQEKVWKVKKIINLELMNDGERKYLIK